MNSPVDPPDREELDRERAFLLRSLSDLEAERAADNIDDDTYRVLHDDYTARTAAVLRSIADGEDERPTAVPAMSWGRRIAIGAAVVLFIGVAGWWLAGALGDRGANDFASGNRTTIDDKNRAENFEAELKAQPDNVGLHLAYARFLSATDAAAALRQYGIAAQLDPKNPEGPAYGGWLLYVKLGQVDSALMSVDKALERDPFYADAQFFKGMILFRGKGDAAGAIPLFQAFLAANPDHQLAGDVRTVLAQAVAAANAPSTATSTPASPPTGSGAQASTTVP